MRKSGTFPFQFFWRKLIVFDGRLNWAVYVRANYPKNCLWWKRKLFMRLKLWQETPTTVKIAEHYSESFCKHFVRDTCCVWNTTKLNLGHEWRLVECQTRETRCRCIVYFRLSQADISRLNEIPFTHTFLIISLSADEEGQEKSFEFSKK